METITRRILRWSGAAVAFGMALFAGAVPLHAQVNCAALPHWTNRPLPPQVNQVHIFCGEWDAVNNRPKGFHSRPGGLDPATVANFQIVQPANAQGVYVGQWSYAGHPMPTKISTMFPDACTMPEVLNSIVYAALNQIPCPLGAPAWASCGTNRPNPVPPGGGPYCQSADGTLFTIAGASLGNGNVNTAFPLY